MPSKRYKPQRRIKPKRSRLKKVVRNHFFWVGIGGVFLLIGIIYSVFFTPFLKIEHVFIEGNVKVSTEKLEYITQEHIVKNLLFLKINNLLLADTSKVKEEIIEEFPEVESVLIDTTFPDKVYVGIKERSGVAVWCQRKDFTIEVSDGENEGAGETVRSYEQCFAVDENGIIFEEKDPEREMVIQNGARIADLGDQVIEPNLLLHILAFQEAMDSLELFTEVGLRVVTAKVVSSERVNIKISEGWEVYINPAESIDWQITKIELVLDQEIPFAKRPFLEYIDLRFGDQAYVKYSN